MPTAELTAAPTERIAAMWRPDRRDIAPTDPQSRLGWCLTQIVDLAPTLGLDDRTLGGLLIWYYEVAHGPDLSAASAAFLRQNRVDCECAP